MMLSKNNLLDML